VGFDLTTLVVISTDCISSCKSNYHTITTTTTPNMKLNYVKYLLNLYHIRKWICVNIKSGSNSLTLYLSVNIQVQKNYTLSMYNVICVILSWSKFVQIFVYCLYRTFLLNSTFLSVLTHLNAILKWVIYIHWQLKNIFSGGNLSGREQVPVNREKSAVQQKRTVQTINKNLYKFTSTQNHAYNIIQW
jgi:hypothetical protein